MKYIVYVEMSAIAGSTQEICRDIAFEEIDWNYEKIKE